MKQETINTKIVRDLNILDLIGIFLILIIAFILQFTTGELPCPLCLLQRVGLYFIAFGLLMNINGHGSSLRNYAISGLGAMLMGATALRQVLLHIVPGSGGYGNPILGLHLYTWSLIIASLFLLSILFSMLFNVRTSAVSTRIKSSSALHFICKTITMLYLLLALFAAVTTFMECGFGYCPDNPVHYQYAKNQQQIIYTSAANHLK